MSTRPISDMLGRSLTVPIQPARIVSLCPSQTETLFDLGLGARVVGSTRYCIHPAPAVTATVRVGGTKKVDLELVRGLRPDLIIAEKEENPREMVDALSEISPVYVTDVVDQGSAFEMIRKVGSLTGTSECATRLVSQIETDWNEMPQFSRKLRTGYLIWRKPWMAAGATTYIDDLLRTVGLDNVFSSGKPSGKRYPDFSIEELIERQPELVLLSSEPYPFQARHVEELQAALPGAQILLTDGEPWSWYGSRMRLFPKLIRDLHAQIKTS